MLKIIQVDYNYGNEKLYNYGNENQGYTYEDVFY